MTTTTLHHTLHVAELLLWAVMAVSAAYILLFALAALLPRRRRKDATCEGRQGDEGGDAPTLPCHRFLVLFPAYAEDAVIVGSVHDFVSRQTYPATHYRVVVVSDHMQAATNEQLRQLPVTLLQPTFDHSSKARALQHAISTVGDADSYDYVVVLDADNTVQPSFLHDLARTIDSRRWRRAVAIQCHRTAKNTDSDVAMLDGVSEEVNNSIFRRGHNRLRLSSALIGSGMCFSYRWFADNVQHLSTAGEDRELEALLLRQRIHIHFADDIYVMDQKVSTDDGFQRQRLRWMSAQLHALLAMLPHLPKALLTLNADYADKTLQQALLPRSILLVTAPLLATAVTIAAPTHALKWWLLTAATILAIALAIPRRLRTRALLSKVGAMPRLTARMMANIAHMDRKNRNFIHTQHQ